MSAAETMQQQAPYPHILGRLVGSLGYKRGWLFQLADLDRGQGSQGPDAGHQHHRPGQPFAPSHGHGQDPYLIRELGTEQDRRTSFRNELNPERADHG